ncbi:MAG: hypothetical protein Q4B65_01505 [Candidatus Saccharibacteria bacterium]|nr:hypothetical protein [Candidatus Saccharibacteria bacterium]
MMIIIRRKWQNTKRKSNVTKNTAEDEKIAEINEEKAKLEEEQTSFKLMQCIKEAEINYAVSDEESSSAGTDVHSLLILVKRIGSGIDAKISCHNKYKTDVYETEINRLKAAKSENEAHIEDAENAIEYQKNYTPRKSLYCTTNGYGNSIYTHCF